MKQWIIIILASLLLSGCGQGGIKAQQPDVFVSLLKDAGYEVTAEAVEPHIFTGDRYLLTLANKEDFRVYVYVYDTAEQAAQETGGIGKDGYQIEFAAQNGKKML